MTEVTIWDKPKLYTHDSRKRRTYKTKVVGHFYGEVPNPVGSTYPTRDMRYLILQTTPLSRTFIRPETDVVG